MAETYNDTVRDIARMIVTIVNKNILPIPKVERELAIFTVFEMVICESLKSYSTDDQDRILNTIINHVKYVLHNNIEL